MSAILLVIVLLLVVYAISAEQGSGNGAKGSSEKDVKKQEGDNGGLR